MSNKRVSLTVAASGAVYVNDTRITDRSTKPWGGSATVYYEDKVQQDDVADVLVKNGYKRLLRKIDTEPYMSQAKAALEKTQ